MTFLLLQISGTALLQAFVVLVVAALIFWLLWWFIGYVGIPEPFNKVIRVVIGLAAVLFLINFLLSLIGTPLVKWP